MKQNLTERQHIDHLKNMIAHARTAHQNAYRRMRQDMAFFNGAQWGAEATETHQQRYTVNLCQRHVANRRAALYARNPNIAITQQKGFLRQFWDGEAETLHQSQQNLQSDPENDQAALIVAEAYWLDSQAQYQDDIANVLEALYDFFLHNHQPSYKEQIKSLVTRTLITGIGWQEVRIETDPSPHLPTDPVQKLVFDFPDSLSILVDPACRNLIGLTNCRWLARERHYTVAQLLDNFDLDEADLSQGQKTALNADPDAEEIVKVWQIWHKEDKKTYWIADQIDRFLLPPETPPPLPGFFPLHPLIFNPIESDDTLFAPSDIYLMRDMQREYNRAREALRQHRIANLPGYLGLKGSLNASDRQRLLSHEPHEFIEINPVGPNLRPADLIAEIPKASFNPALYDTGYIEKDIELVVGSQTADLGYSRGVSATEASINESSRLTALSSNADDLDDHLSHMAQIAGYLMLTQFSAENVRHIAGPGAIWPDLKDTATRQRLCQNLKMRIKAGSTNSPNQAAEAARFERMAPWLFQMPGISPESVIRRLSRILDLDLEDLYIDGLPPLALAAANPSPQPSTGSHS